MAPLRWPNNRLLGYQLRPGLSRWRGTPIPPVQDPLRETPARRAIAHRVWWNGPSWTVLRNASHYLWHVWDYGTDEDIAFTQADVPKRLWIRALAAARPGLVSAGSYVFWSYVLGLMSGEEICDWPQTAHRYDYKPLVSDERAERLLRAATSPVERIAGRLDACICRGSSGDFGEVVEEIRAWSDRVCQAAVLRTRDGRRMRDIRCALANPPPAVAAKLSPADRALLRRFAAAPAVAKRW